MSNKIKKSLLVFCLATMAVTVWSQDYKLAAGARLGYPLSASIKYFVTESNALEAYIGTRGFGSGFAKYRSTSISGAYLRHQDLEGVDGLKYYFGAGASVYFWNFDFFTEASTTTIGLQGYLGLEYTFDNVPISITIDWVPTYFLNSFVSSFGSGYGALGVRYILSR